VGAAVRGRERGADRSAARFPVTGNPSAIAIVDGQLWVGTTRETGRRARTTRITVLDPADGHVISTLPLPYPAIGITPATEGGAWITFGERVTVTPAALRISGP
jgi:hypothetical protein